MECLSNFKKTCLAGADNLSGRVGRDEVREVVGRVMGTATAP